MSQDEGSEITNTAEANLFEKFLVAAEPNGSGIESAGTERPAGAGQKRSGQRARRGRGGE